MVRTQHVSVVWPTVNIVSFLSLLFTLLIATEWGDEENLWLYMNMCTVCVLACHSLLLINVSNCNRTINICFYKYTGCVGSLSLILLFKKEVQTVVSIHKVEQVIYQQYLFLPTGGDILNEIGETSTFYFLNNVFRVWLKVAEWIFFKIWWRRKSRWAHTRTLTLIMIKQIHHSHV